jgi:hypothetical protein
VEDTDISDDDTLTDKAEVNLNMLHARVLNEVSGEVHCTGIVAVDKSALVKWPVELQGK